MEARGLSNASDANKGINQMWPNAAPASQSQQPEHPDKDDEEFDMQEYIQQFCDKETVAFFKKADRIPPLSEWQCAWDLINAAPELTDYHSTPDKLKSNSKRVQLHFYHTNLQALEKSYERNLTSAGMQLLNANMDHLQTNLRSCL